MVKGGRYNKLQHDFKMMDSTPTLFAPSPMLEVIVKIYTPTMFHEFQEQLKLTLRTQHARMPTTNRVSVNEARLDPESGGVLKSSVAPSVRGIARKGKGALECVVKNKRGKSTSHKDTHQHSKLYYVDLHPTPMHSLQETFISSSMSGVVEPPQVYHPHNYQPRYTHNLTQGASHELHETKLPEGETILHFIVVVT
ncbi:hypothetical protein H6P81_009785 [Aristolochia fimbriata]|uniref:Uncharacterized protein n=1 Tax=Aristolochia fimbriata TaxID=158543 RepID=A0AAV7ELW8_ARIFI|nr:hypothetical protein H6P81_009785 [Aristolochia fimbriata]